MDEIIGWRGQRIVGARSRTNGDFWARDWRDMVLETTGAIEAKACEVAGRAPTWFDPEALSVLQEANGRCCFLQSMKSEDTVTWAAFGSCVPDEVLTSIVDEAFGSSPRSGGWQRFLWKRFVHPQTGRSQNGPEPDVVLFQPQSSYVVEAKWLSDLDDRQGRDGTLGQLALRATIARRESPDSTRRGVLVIAPSAARYPYARSGTFAEYFAVDGNEYAPKDRAADVEARARTWERIIDVIERHLGRVEVVDYLRWRLRAIDQVP